MTTKKSIVRVASTAVNADRKERVRDLKAQVDLKQRKKSGDSFVNFAMNMGLGTDNPMSGSSYGFNPVTRNRVGLEWIHRGSWLGGVAVDLVAEDMTRAGIEIKGGLKPDEIELMQENATTLGIWTQICSTIKWSRLYGGAIAVMLIDGQDTSTPLRLSTIRKDQFCGLLVLDRWMIDPSLNDLVTDLGPSLGQPKYYSVTAQAPALCRQKIHYSRVIRLEGIELPYWQKVTENLWGISVLERLYDRMIAFDSASTGAAQLVYKSYMRTYKIKDMREIIAAGGDAQAGLIQYVDMMRRFQGIEGITLIDGEDEVQADTHSAFGGLADALQQFGQQISGALQIPLTRLFGQSPAGFSSGDSDLRTYYDGINSQQNKALMVGVTKIYRAIAASNGIKIPDGFKIEFKSLWQLTEEQKTTIAEGGTRAILAAEDNGTISRKTSLKELRQLSHTTGIFSNITDEDIEDAESNPPPNAEELLANQASKTAGELPAKVEE